VCSRLSVDVRTADMLSDADLADDFYKSGANGKFCVGNPHSIVVVRLAYAFPAILPMLAVFSNGSVGQSRTGLVNDVPNLAGWNHMVYKAIAFENEGYQSSGATCS
jgi:hypothetical protein